MLLIKCKQCEKGIAITTKMLYYIEEQQKRCYIHTNHTTQTAHKEGAHMDKQTLLKQYYITQIAELVERCQDQGLLALICRLLEEEEKQSKKENKGD